jgi:xylulose-5-phosphate/fructose-6-phosphate phosphoketolase
MNQAAPVAISGPTVLGRSSDEDIRKLLEAHGYEVHFIEGDDPMPMHQAFAATLDTCYAQIRAQGGRWPAGGGDVSGAPGAAAERPGQSPAS